MSILDKIKELESQKQAHIQGFKKESLAIIEEKIKELNELGFNYSLVDSAPVKRKRRSKEQMMKDGK